MSAEKTAEPHKVAAFYKFVDLGDHVALQDPLQCACEEAGAVGTILLAHEGVNGTISAPHDGVDQVLTYLRALPGLAELPAKFSSSEGPAFNRMKVRLKSEIVTMGQPLADPAVQVGAYVDPEDWNALIDDPETLVVDTRNTYECDIGTFKNAVDPKTGSFRDFPKWVDEELRPMQEAGGYKKIAMFCTGGIRCEKATAHLLNEGFEDVFHLNGGILKYLETMPESESLWDGQCFVFDQRVSVGHGLEVGDYDLCHACRHPITAEDKASVQYEEGVSCPHCFDKSSPERKARFADRQKQIHLAKERQEKHIGRRFEKHKRSLERDDG